MEFRWIQCDGVPLDSVEPHPLHSVGWGFAGFSGIEFHWILWDGVLLDSVGWGSAGFSGMGFHWIQWVTLDLVEPTVTVIVIGTVSH